MRISSGIDLVDVGRFREKTERTPAMLDRLFTKAEREGRDHVSLAGVFAVKEALRKADNTLFEAWIDVEILAGEDGKPAVRLLATDESAQSKDISISITHDGAYAAAVAFILYHD